MLIDELQDLRNSVEVQQSQINALQRYVGHIPLLQAEVSSLRHQIEFSRAEISRLQSSDQSDLESTVSDLTQDSTTQIDPPPEMENEVTLSETSLTTWVRFVDLV